MWAGVYRAKPATCPREAWTSRAQVRRDSLRGGGGDSASDIARTVAKDQGKLPCLEGSSKKRKLKGRNAAPHVLHHAFLSEPGS